MAILPHSGLETTPAGTANVQSIIDANWQRLEDAANPANNHHDMPDAASITFNRNNGEIQEANVTQNVTVAVSNLTIGKKLEIIIHTDAARTVTVPGAWQAAGTTNLATLAAGAIVLQVWNTNQGVVFMTNP